MNVRLLIISVVVLAAVVPSAMFWHTFQLRRNRDVFLTRANEAEQRARNQSADEATQKQQWREAARNLHRYLQLKPGEAQAQEARARLAIVTDEGAEGGAGKYQAADLYIDAIRRSNHPAELKRRLGALVLQWPGVRMGPNGSFSQAYQYVLALYDENTTHDSAEKAIRAIASYRLEQLKGADFASRTPEVQNAVAEMKAVADNPPDDVTVAGLYVRACLELQQAVKGEDWFRYGLAAANRVVEVNPNDARAYLMRYQYRTTSAQIRGFAPQLANADADLAKAVQLAPRNIDVLLNAGARAANRNEFARAREHFEKVREVDPKDARAYLGLGQIHVAQKEVDKAIDVWKQGIRILDPRDQQSLRVHIQLVQQLINGLLSTDRPKEVLDVVEGLRNRVQRTPYLASNDQEHILVALDYFEGLSHEALGEYGEAIPLLEHVVHARSRPSSNTETAQSLHAIQTLGTCYQRIGQPDQAVRMYQDAAATYAGLASLKAAKNSTSQPQFMAANQMEFKLRAASGDLLLASGRYDDAIRDYERALRLVSKLASPEERPEAQQSLLANLALAHYRRLVNLPENQRDESQWKALATVLNDARTAYHDSPPLPLVLLKIESLAARGQTKAALEALGKAEEKDFPNSLAMWQAAIIGQDTWGDPGEADRKLEQYVARAPNKNAAVILRASLLGRRRQWKEVRELLLNEFEPETDSEQLDLEVQLAQLDQLLGDFGSADQRLSNLLDKQTANLSFTQKQRLVRALAGLALAAPNPDSSEIDARIAQLKKLEGEENGTWWRYLDGIRLLKEIKESTDPKIRTVEGYQAEIQRLRPDWSYGYVLEAEIAIKRNDLNNAVDLLKHSIRMGNRSLAIYQRLTELLFQQGRFPDVDTVLSQLGDRVLDSQGLSAIAVRRDVDEILAAGSDLDSENLPDSTQRIDRAVELARRNVERSPDNVYARLWLGQTLILAGNNVEAESTLRDTVASHPESVAARTTLFNYYLASQQRDAALEVVGQLESANLTEEEASRPFALAQCYEKLGDLQKATENYREAIKREPQNIAVLSQAAQLFARTEPDAAEETLRRLVVVSKDPGTANRQLAVQLASRGGKPRWEEALTMVNSLLEQSKEGQEGVVNRRLKATILSTRGGDENRYQAIDLLLRIVEGSPEFATPADFLQLAGLYEQQGDDELALQQIQKVEQLPNLTPDHWAAVVRFYLKNDKFDQAKSALESLQSQDPDSVTTVALRARYLKATGQTGQIQALVDDFKQRQLDKLQGPGRRAELLSRLAALYASVEISDLAEDCFREAMDLDSATWRSLAAWLANQGRNAQALQLAIDHRAEVENSPQSMAFALNLLTVGKPTPKDFESAGDLLAEASKRFPKDLNVLTALAMVHYRQHHLDQAIKSFRRILEMDTNNLMALNNLAWTLAEEGTEMNRALEHVDHAIDFYGPNLQLLDTRGVILLLRDQVPEAVADLEKVANDRNADAQHQFHLALALQRSGDFDSARKWLEAAHSSGLSPEKLSPFEQRLLDELERALGT